MIVLLVFCLGVLNFAAHKAVIESGHPLLAQTAWYFQPLQGRLSLIVEFAMLWGALVMAAAGSVGWGLVYACYTGLNTLAAWLIYTRRL